MNQTNRFSQVGSSGGKPLTEEEKDAFMDELKSARSKISFPANP